MDGRENRLLHENGEFLVSSQGEEIPADLVLFGVVYSLIVVLKFLIVTTFNFEFLRASSRVVSFSCLTIPHGNMRYTERDTRMWSCLKRSESRLRFLTFVNGERSNA
jgi:hypothetical protein